MNENKELLPLGTILYIKEGTQKLMVVGRGIEYLDEGESKFMDYMGCLYPEGIDPKHSIFFNHEDVDRIVFKGFTDEDEERFHQVYDEWIKNVKAPKNII